MSGGKKKPNRKRTYSQGEFIREVRQTCDDAVKRTMLMCIVAARDEFDMDEDKLMQFMQTMQRYIGYESDGLIDLKAYSDSLLKQTGIDLRLTRW